MEFKSITITNFLSYFDKNEIDFSPMTTIVIGQNNTGKSKLFDAINFVLYGRIYDTQKETWVMDDNEISELILNKHKINEALKNGEEMVETSVSILIDDIGRGDILVQVERIFSFKFSDGKYVFSTKNLKLTEIDKLDGKSLPYMGNDALERMKMYFSDSIKDFFLFQGEAASKIMRLQRGGNFQRAVKEIARLEIFEKAKEYAEKYEETISRGIQIKAGKGKKQKAEQKELQREIDELNEERKRYKQEKDEAENNATEYRSVLEKNEDELSHLKEFEEYFNQKKALEENQRNIKKELEEINSQKYSVVEDSVFYKVREKIASFKEFYSKLEKKGDVPPSIPQVEIRKALEHCRCTICNSDLSEGTEGRKFAESRLSKGDTDKLGDYLRQLHYSAGEMGESIKNIPDKLSDLLRRKESADTKKSNLIKESERLTEKLEKTNLDKDTAQEKIQHINEVKRTVSRYQELLKKAESEANKEEGFISYIEKQISEKKKKLEFLVVDDDEVDIEDKIKLYYSSKLHSVMEKLHDDANKTAYEQVEKRANEYYKEMTQENAALVGDIKINLQNSEIYTVDEAGVRIMNINQGNRISIQLAVIAGILTVAQDQFGIQYPFVTDAPVSHLGGDNKSSTIKTMIRAFDQSVIIIKDDISTKNKESDEIRKLIQDSSDIEAAYELSLSNAENINDQFTVIKRIKG